MLLKNSEKEFGDHFTYLLASFVSVVGACDMSGLEGKIVLLTGASSGIGAEAAQHFARLKGPPFTSG